LVIKSTVKLTDDQEQAMALIRKGKRHTLLYGGSRSGKTFLIVLVVVLRALMFPGSRHLIYRLRLKDAIQSIWLETLPKVLSFYPGIQKYVELNETRHVATFVNGSEIWIAGVDDARSEDSVLGKEYVTIYHNEASQIPFMTAWKVRTRLAQKVDGCRAREFVDLNPTTRAHWTSREFVEHVDPIHSKPGEKVPIQDPDEYVWHQINPAGNMANLDSEYVKSLQAAPESMRRRFYMGEYSDDNDLVVFNFPIDGYHAGKQFDEWVRDVGPQNVRLTAGLDIGFEDADGFVIIAYCPHHKSIQSKDASKRFLIYEYKSRRSGLSELAKAIQTAIEWANNKSADLGLPSQSIRIFSDTGGGGAKMVYDLRTVHHLPVLPAYKRDKLAAIELLQDEVKAGNFVIPADGAFANEAQEIVWTKDVETGAIVRTIDDRQYHPDIMDAILYAMRSVWYNSLDSASSKR